MYFYSTIFLIFICAGLVYITTKQRNYIKRYTRSADNWLCAIKEDCKDQIAELERQNWKLKNQVDDSNTFWKFCISKKLIDAKKATKMFEEFCKEATDENNLSEK